MFLEILAILETCGESLNLQTQFEVCPKGIHSPISQPAVSQAEIIKNECIWLKLKAHHAWNLCIYYTIGSVKLIFIKNKKFN